MCNRIEFQIAQDWYDNTEITAGTASSGSSDHNHSTCLQDLQGKEWSSSKGVPVPDICSKCAGGFLLKIIFFDFLSQAVSGSLSFSGCAGRCRKIRNASTKQIPNI